MGKKSKKANTPKPSEQEKALAKVATKKFAVYKRLYRPLAKRQLESTKATPGKIKEAQGIVNADIMQDSTRRQQGLARASAVGGPRTAGSNRAIFARDAAHRATGKARGIGQGLAREGIEGREREGKLRHIALGHGIARGTMASMTDQARRATAESIQKSQIDLEESNMLAESIGQGLGAYTGMGGDFGFGGGGGNPGFHSSQLGAAGTPYAGRSMR